MKKSFISNSSFKFLLGTLVLLFLLIIISDVNTQPPPPPIPLYTISAHGNTTYGVDRNSLKTPINFGYSIGNCTHCHEQHASIGGAEPSPVTGPQGYGLFYDHWIDNCDLFCFRCHSDIGAVEQPVTNYLFSCNFGGETCTAYLNLRDHFCNANSNDDNCGSRHRLSRIRTIIQDNGYGWGYPADPDPCSACHNPHLAKRKGNKQYPSYTPDRSTISRPSEHISNPLNLWGDGSGEKMSDYIQANGGTYKAPYYGDTTGSKFEPSGSSSPSDGTNLTDYVTFCMDCHKNEQYDPERSATVKAIKWRDADPAPGQPQPDRHGEYPSNTCVPGLGEGGSLRPPYSDFANSNYVLSCTDCHEPHAGRKRLHLIRRFINGEAVAADAGTRADGTCDTCPDDWLAICERCHTLTAGHKANTGCLTCHRTKGVGDAMHGSTWVGAGGCQGEPLF